MRAFMNVLVMKCRLCARVFCMVWCHL